MKKKKKPNKEAIKKALEYVELLQAFIKGETIQLETIYNNWVDDFEPVWNFPSTIYRRKPKWKNQLKLTGLSQKMVF